jgi:hypothetical protein
MATFVSGALYGGWWFEPLVHERRRRGHEAYSLPHP